MKNIDIINVYKATESLSDKGFSHDQMWEIYKFRKRLREIVEFYTEEENKINKKYLPYADKDKVLRGENYQNYLNEKEELNNMEMEFAYDKLELPLVDGVDFKIIEALEDFIEFKP